MALAAVTLLPACSVYAAYQKCGVHGCAGDAQVKANVYSLFEQHPELEPPNLLTVQSIDGVVYLYGIVDTDFERSMAASVAGEANGAIRVVNSIGISGSK